MTSLTPMLSAGNSRSAALHEKHPEWWAAVVVAAGWIMVVLLHWHHVVPGRWMSPPSDMAAAHGHDLAAHAIHRAGPWHDMAMWLSMTIAMMVPLMASAMAYVVLNSFPSRRQRAVAIFIGAFLAGWLVAGIPVTGVALGLRQTTSVDEGTLAVAALLFAAAWQGTRWKRRAVLSCHRVIPLRPRGRRADLSVARFGALHSVRCLRSCGPLMVAMVVAPFGLLGMIGVTVAVIAEERSLTPLRHRGPMAAFLVGFAALVAVTR